MASTMRISVPPVRFSDPQVVVSPRRVKLAPFEGQTRKYSGIHRFPQLVMRDSGIKNAGIGLFLGEKVRAGQALTLFRKNRISEAAAKLLKLKVSHLWFLLLLQGDLNSLYSLQGNRHIRINRAACCCLDSKPTVNIGLDYMSSHHETAGMANSSETPNAKFIDVGFDTILVAKFDMDKGTELFPKYTW